MLTKDTAICIRVLDYSETSQIVTFFARATGKLSAIAKGSKRPKSTFDGPIEMFSAGNIVFSDATREKLATLTEFEQQPCFARLGANLYGLNCCLLAAELLNQLMDEYDPHCELFDKFLQFLQDTNEQPAANSRQRHILSLLILFQLALLNEIGLRPVLNACANCRSHFGPEWSEVYFSSSGNGLICRDCEPNFPDKIRLTLPAANCLTNLKMVAHTDEEYLNEIEKVLVYHFTELLHRPPKMAKHVLKQ